MTDPSFTDIPTKPVPISFDFSLSHYTLVHRITSVVLNGKTFAAWNRSPKVYLGGKEKAHLSSTTQPIATDPTCAKWDIDNCTILG
ncbi:hypothetical protein CsSME_00025473 [Camellia sinensis var. sinensis]